MASFAAGLLAGFGIAVPCGTVSVLIMTTGMRYGFPRGFMAGARPCRFDHVPASRYIFLKAFVMR